MSIDSSECIEPIEPDFDPVEPVGIACYHVRIELRELDKPDAGQLGQRDKKGDHILDVFTESAFTPTNGSRLSTRRFHRPNESMLTGRAPPVRSLIA